MGGAEDGSRQNWDKIKREGVDKVRARMHAGRTSGMGVVRARQI